MTSQKEIMEAFTDYQYGRNGFEKAPGFKSEAAKHLKDDDDF